MGRACCEQFASPRAGTATQTVHSRRAPKKWRARVVNSLRRRAFAGRRGARTAAALRRANVALRNAT
eukprot:452710-Lingulodinium_polyedra.AAC.1